MSWTHDITFTMLVHHGLIPQPHTTSMRKCHSCRMQVMPAHNLRLCKSCMAWNEIRTRIKWYEAKPNTTRTKWVRGCTNKRQCYLTVTDCRFKTPACTSEYQISKASMGLHLKNDIVHGDQDAWEQPAHFTGTRVLVVWHSSHTAFTENAESNLSGTKRERNSSQPVHSCVQCSC